MASNASVNPEKHVNRRKMGLSLTAGGLAGIVTKSATAPLSRIKTLRQLDRSLKLEHRGIIAMGRHIVHKEGFWSLWKGNGANCVRIFPNYALKFGCNDLFKDMLRKPNQAELTVSQKFLAGLMAGLIQTSVTYPLDLVKTRLAMFAEGGKPLYTGIIDCATKTVQVEGLRSLWKGFLPCLVGNTPYTALQLTLFDVFQSQLNKVFARPAYVSPPLNLTPSETMHFVLESGFSPAVWGVARDLLAGAGAGVMANMTIYPAGTIKTRMQVNGALGRPKEFSSTLDCLVSTVGKEGVRGLYRGLYTSLVKMVPSSAIKFFAYERFRAALYSYDQR